MRNKRGANESNNSIVALLFSHINGMDEGFNQIKQLQEDGIHVSICPDESIRDVFTNEELLQRTGANELISLDMLEERKEEFAHFHIPITPFSLVGELLAFNDSKKSIKTLLWALMKGKRVSAASNGADPYHDMWEEADLHHGTPLLKRKMKAQLNELKGYGIKLVNEYKELRKLCEKEKAIDAKKVITATDIETLAKRNEPYIQVTNHTIITPLAKDLLREKNIEIVKPRGG